MEPFRVLCLTGYWHTLYATVVLSKHIRILFVMQVASMPLSSDDAYLNIPVVIGSIWKLIRNKSYTSNWKMVVSRRGDEKGKLIGKGFFINFLGRTSKACMNINHSWFQTFAVFCMLYVFFWVIPRASEFYMPTFRNTLSVPSSLFTYLPMKMEDRVFRNVGI